MNYRHAYHAGNFADVMKHTALVAVLLHLRKKDAGFAVIDTHAGRGLYDLSSTEAEKTGEAKDGIARLNGNAPHTDILSVYLDIARSFGPHYYPGSPLIAARLLRPQDRLVAIEKHPAEHDGLAAALKPFGKAHAVCADGYAQLSALLPPPERRCVMLIDPPFEAQNEFVQLSKAFSTAQRRFANAIMLIWFPVKTKNDAHALSGELLTRGATKLLRLELDVGAHAQGRLRQAGLLVVNPPHGFDKQMRETLQALAAPLGRDDPAKWNVEWLAGEA